MAYRRCVFCEFEFLKKFRSSNAHFSWLDNNDALKNWLGVARFIQKSQLLLDVDATTFANNVRQDDAIFKLWKKASEGTLKMEFLDEHGINDVDFLIARPQGLTMSYLLTKSQAMCQFYYKTFGVVVIPALCWSSNEKAKKYRYLFRDCGMAVERNESIEWSHILRPTDYKLSNCNSMIIIDNYIGNNVRENLYAILKSMLPESLSSKVEFHLTILTERKHDDMEWYGKNLYKELCAEVKRLRPQLNCNVELYVTNGKSRFHDRTILTNNVKIDCLAGFDLITKYGKAQKGTQVFIMHPGIQDCSDSCDEKYSQIIREVYKVIRKIEDSEQRGCGEGKHWPAGQCSKNRLICEPITE